MRVLRDDFQRIEMMILILNIEESLIEGW
jgi:hypothetical protein